MGRSKEKKEQKDLEDDDGDDNEGEQDDKEAGNKAADEGARQYATKILKPSLSPYLFRLDLGASLLSRALQCLLLGATLQTRRLECGQALGLLGLCEERKR